MGGDGPRRPVTWVSGQSEFEELCRCLLREPRVGLDVETTLSEPVELCTMQLATAKESWVVDALAVRLDPVVPLFEGQDVVKIIHYAAFERKVMGRYGIRIHNVFDTCTTSRQLFPDAVGGHGLAALCARHLDLEMSKVQQTSDWTRRPLSPDQLAYAALDAEVLIDLWRILEDERAERQRRMKAGSSSLFASGSPPSRRPVSSASRTPGGPLPPWWRRRTPAVDGVTTAEAAPPLELRPAADLPPPPSSSSHDEADGPLRVQDVTLDLVGAHAVAVVNEATDLGRDALVSALLVRLGFAADDRLAAAVVRGFLRQVVRSGTLCETAEGIVRRSAP